jgi:hypothetical protein
VYPRRANGNSHLAPDTLFRPDSLKNVYILLPLFQAANRTVRICSTCNKPSVTALSSEC